jgi:hypothetical protein
MLKFLKQMIFDTWQAKITVISWGQPDYVLCTGPFLYVDLRTRFHCLRMGSRVAEVYPVRRA